MSSAVPPPGTEDGPSEEEVREYLAQMREAPADQVIAEIVQALLNAAQVKLGRQDARLLIDVTASVADSARGRSSDELLGQVDQAVSQLRLAQVEAEREVADAPGDEANDIPAGAASGTTTPPPSQPAPPPQQPPSSGGGKLWTPGG